MRCSVVAVVVGAMVCCVVVVVVACHGEGSVVPPRAIWGEIGALGSGLGSRPP